MAQTVELLTSLDTFQDLHILADGKDGKVRVERADLRRLLIDHTCMINALKGAAVQVRTEPPPRRRDIDPLSCKLPLNFRGDNCRRNNLPSAFVL